MKKRFEVLINGEHCKACGVCLEFCPQDVLGVSEQRNKAGFYPVEVKKPEECTGCGHCALMCPDACIEIYRVPMEESVQS